MKKSGINTLSLEDLDFIMAQIEIIFIHPLSPQNCCLAINACFTKHGLKYPKYTFTDCPINSRVWGEGGLRITADNNFSVFWLACIILGLTTAGRVWPGPGLKIPPTIGHSLYNADFFFTRENNNP